MLRIILVFTAMLMLAACTSAPPQSDFVGTSATVAQNSQSISRTTPALHR